MAEDSRGIEGVADSDAEMSTTAQFIPMEDWHWSLCPLWVHLARYQGRDEEGLDHSRLFGWASLIDDWEEMNRLLRDDQNFQHTLSTAQRRSFEILRSWWIGAYCAVELIEGAMSFIRSLELTETDFDPSDNEYLLKIGEESRSNASLYHATLLRHFLLEFHPRCWEPYDAHESLRKIGDSRDRSARWAIVQKLAYSITHPIHENAHNEPYPMVEENSLSGHALIRPRYLWDSERGQTVTVSNLPTCPEYVCVSHTWGRWRTRTNTRVSGVPWLVPENTRYDVRDIPSQIQKLGVRYIWLDLLCIPQDKSAEANREVAHQASIFKGSSTCIAWINDVDSWDGVMKGLDWIGLHVSLMTSNVDEDETSARLFIAASSASVSAELLKREPETNDPATGEPAAWFSSLWTLQECILCPDIELYNSSWIRLEDKRGTPISLQALMVLLSHTHMYCSLTSRVDESFASPRQYEMSIVRTFAMSEKASVEVDREMPRAAWNLFCLRRITRLDEVLTKTSPTNILTSSNLRQCISSRAPAIMSAIGVTDWYHARLSGSEAGQLRPEPLVFGAYPLSFLQEAARKFGAIFYGSMSRSVVRRTTAPGQPDIFVRVNCEGTMLPVSKSHGWSCDNWGVQEDAPLGMKDHESVAGWIIRGDGSVAMQSVGMVAKSNNTKSLHRRVAGMVACTNADAGEDGRRGMSLWETEDMTATLKSISYRSRPVYAVALYHDGRALYGVLLEELPLGICGTSFLTKIGYFEAMDDLSVPLRGVKWIVL